MNRLERTFDWISVTLVLVGMAVDTASTMRSLEPAWQNTLSGVATAITGAFAAEYVLRIVLAGDRRRYVLSFYGVVDLLAWLPTLILGVDSRAVRAVRLLRLLRLLKLARIDAENRFFKALWSMKEHWLVFITTTVVVVYVASTCLYMLEREAQPETFGSIPDCMWWAVVTITTVGYGDTYPVTSGGRLIASVFALMGIGIVGMAGGITATALVGSERRVQPGEFEATGDAP